MTRHTTTIKQQRARGLGVMFKTKFSVWENSGCMQNIGKQNQPVQMCVAVAGKKRGGRILEIADKTRHLYIVCVCIKCIGANQQ
jgi:hypothetical protein